MTEYTVEESITPSEIQTTMVSERVLSRLKPNEMILTKDTSAEDFSQANVYF